MLFSKRMRVVCFVFQLERYDPKKHRRHSLWNSSNNRLMTHLYFLYTGNQLFKIRKWLISSSLRFYLFVIFCFEIEFFEEYFFREIIYKIKRKSDFFCRWGKFERKGKKVIGGKSKKKLQNRSLKKNFGQQGISFFLQQSIKT